MKYFLSGFLFVLAALVKAEPHGCDAIKGKSKFAISQCYDHQSRLGQVVSDIASETDIATYDIATLSMIDGLPRLVVNLLDTENEFDSVTCVIEESGFTKVSKRYSGNQKLEWARESISEVVLAQYVLESERGERSAFRCEYKIAQDFEIHLVPLSEDITEGQANYLSKLLENTVAK